MNCIHCLREDSEIRKGELIVLELRYDGSDFSDSLCQWTGGVWHMECAQVAGIPK